MISNRTVCGVFDFKPAMFVEKKFLAGPLWCCGLLFDTLDRLTLAGSVENEECGVWKTRSVENEECGKCGV